MNRGIKIPLDQIADNKILAYNHRSSIRVDEMIENTPKKSSNKEPSIMTFGNTYGGFNVENGMLSIVTNVRQDKSPPNFIESTPKAAKSKNTKFGAGFYHG